MHKENYITEQNIVEKVKQWQKILETYKIKSNPFTFNNSALIVIDMQNYFLDEKSHAFIPSGKMALKNIIKIVDAFRKNQRPIIFTYFAVLHNEEDPIKRWWSDTVIDGSRESRISEEFNLEKNMQKNEIIMRKKTYSPFYETKLEDFLKKHNIKNIVVTGVITNLCCETAVREAFVRNFNVFVPIDAMAAYNEETHISSLRNISYGFATTLSTKEILRMNFNGMAFNGVASDDI